MTLLAPASGKTIVGGDARPTIEFHRWCNEVTRALLVGSAVVDYPALVLANLPPGLLSFAAVGTTDGITEGVTNLYFTNERAQDAVGAALVDSASIDFTYTDAANTITAIIAATYVGQASITTLGTITTGTWNGTIISLARGGTGADFSTRTANTVWAGPVSGVAAAPAFRALVSADIPVLSSLYQPLDAGLTSISGLTTAADQSIYTTALDVYATYSLTAGGRALSAVAGTANTAPYFSASNVVTLQAVSASGRALWNVAGTSGSFAYLSAADTWSLWTLTAAGRAILDDADATAQRATLGLVIGTNVQAADATLTALAGANWALDAIPVGTGADTVTQLAISANTFLGKSAGAVEAISVGVDQLVGRTGSNPLGVVTKSGLPISTATQTALDLKQPLDTQLTDLAALSYASNALKVVRVNAAANTFELVTAASAPTKYALIAASSVTSVALVTVTDGTTPWSFSVTAGTSYRVTVIANYQSNNVANGIKLGVTGAGGAVGTISGSAYASEIQTSAASELKASLYTHAGAAGAFVQTAGVTVTDSPHSCGMDFVFVCTTSGTLAIQMASTSGIRTTQINIGSMLFVEAI